jgi:signal transduction histidine kinase
MEPSKPSPSSGSPSRNEIDEFVYRVSHDLRSPISTILGFTELLKADHSPNLNAQGQRYLSAITLAAQRLNSMIEGLLFLSRVGRAPDGPRWCEMSGVLESAKGIAVKRTGRHDARWVVPGSLPRVFGVESELRTLFVHLLSNALQHNPKPQPLVEVACREEPDEIVFAVRDEGPGIDPRFQPEVFKIFTRLAAQLEDPGVGMGLPLAKKIAETHGGRVWLESEKGKGAAFFVALPKKS